MFLPKVQLPIRWAWTVELVDKVVQHGSQAHRLVLVPATQGQAIDAGQSSNLEDDLVLNIDNIGHMALAHDSRLQSAVSL